MSFHFITGLLTCLTVGYFEANFPLFWLMPSLLLYTLTARCALTNISPSTGALTAKYRSDTAHYVLFCNFGAITVLLFCHTVR